MMDLVCKDKVAAVELRGDSWYLSLSGSGLRLRIKDYAPDLKEGDDVEIRVSRQSTAKVAVPAREDRWPTGNPGDKKKNEQD